jgi:16S rRNA (guanine527-N7)-methyltransferase
MEAEIVYKYFPNLSDHQKDQFQALGALYADWNTRINVVSRKDIDELYLRHVLHSLGIARVHEFREGLDILDVGTGGGFPGIPLAILFPGTRFMLVDAIAKKIRVVEDVIRGLGLQNAQARQARVEDMDEQFDFIVSRAVAAMPTFVRWTRGRLKKNSRDRIPNGILYLKGGDLTEELAPFPQAKVYPLGHYFQEPFFETKKVVYLPDPGRKKA